jgi:hypothetical protein
MGWILLVGLAYTIGGCIDFGYQQWRHERSVQKEGEQEFFDYSCFLWPIFWVKEAAEWIWKFLYRVGDEAIARWHHGWN